MFYFDRGSATAVRAGQDRGAGENAGAAGSGRSLPGNGDFACGSVVEPDAEGETIGFRSASLDKVSDRKEINFVLAPFLRGQVPKSMKVNAADLLRAALAGSTAASGYKVSLGRLKILSIQIVGDKLVVEADGDISVE